MMGTVLLVGILAAGVVGLGLAWFGLRGRRVDDHPICRRCRFDLVGVYPGVAVCPECGRALAGPGAVRRGARRRRKALLWIAMPFLLLTLGGGGFLGYTGATGYNWYGAAPDWLLESLATSADRSVRAKAVGELAVRVSGGVLANDRGVRLVEQALRAQADESTPWIPAWGDLMDAAIGAGLVGDDQFSAYLARSCKFTLQVRERVRAGDEVAIQVELSPDRVGSATPLAIAFEAGTLILDGQALAGTGHTGSSRCYLGGMGGTCSRTLYHAFDPALGKHALSIDVDATISSSSPSTMMTGAATGPSARVRTRVEAPLEIVGPNEQIVRLAPDPTLAPAILKGLEAEQFRVESSGAGVTMLSGTVYGRRLPADCAFEVLVRVDGREYPWAFAEFPAGGDFGVGSSAQIPVELGDTIDLVFRASEQALLRNSRRDSAWGGEVVLEGVKVTHPAADEVDAGAPDEDKP
ncbi:MAG: hypothetical protein IPJ41_07275 [Phycisphaerales bacterium]|nr:hypothetical protein [Phycisphaerales bacterium]